MFKIIGQVVNVFTQDGGIDKDGKEYNESYKVQLMGEMPLPNGDSKMDLVDLKVDSLTGWNEMQGKKISIDIGEFAAQKGKIIHYVRKGARPEITQ